MHVTNPPEGFVTLRVHFLLQSSIVSQMISDLSKNSNCLKACRHNRPDRAPDANRKPDFGPLQAPFEIERAAIPAINPVPRLNNSSFLADARPFAARGIRFRRADDDSCHEGYEETQHPMPRAAQCGSPVPTMAATEPLHCAERRRPSWRPAYRGWGMRK